MRKVGVLTLTALSALAIVAGVATVTPSGNAQSMQLVRQAEPGDDRGTSSPAPSPDDKGGKRIRTASHGADDTVSPSASPDDKGGRRIRTARAEVGDDNGGHGEGEPGDDKGTDA